MRFPHSTFLLIRGLLESIVNLNLFLEYTYGCPLFISKVIVEVFFSVHVVSISSQSHTPTHTYHTHYTH